MKRFYFYLGTLFLLCSMMNKQVSATNLDSLKNLLVTTTVDTLRINLLNDIGWAYCQVNLEEAYHYAQQAFQNGEKIGYKKGQSRALNMLGIIALSKGSTQKGIKQCLKGLALAESLQDSWLISVNTNTLGNAYNSSGNFQRALKYYQQSLDTAKKINDIKGSAIAAGNIGYLYTQLGHFQQGIKYFKLASEIGKESDNPQILSMAYIRLGGAYLEQKDYEQAIDYQQKALTLAQQSNNRFEACQALHHLGKAQWKKGLIKLGLKNCLSAIKEAESLGNSYVKMEITNTLTAIYLEQKQYIQAVKYAKQGLQLSHQYNFGNMRPALHKKLAKAYGGLGQYQKAYEHSHLYGTLQDSTHTEKNQRIIAELETLYQTQEKEAENQALRIENLRNKKIIQQQNTILIISVIAFVLFVLLGMAVYNVYHIRKKNLEALEDKVKERTQELENSNMTLRQTNDALERFNYIASHDLREPLRNISSFSDLLHKKMNQKGEHSLLEYVQFIKSGAKRMYALIEAIGQVTNIRQHTINLQEVDIQQIVQLTTTNLQQFIEEHHAIIEYQALPIIMADAILLPILFQNLITNGIKYNEADSPRITIHCAETATQYIFEVKDNGIGIDPDYYETIFKAFKRLHHYEQYQGTGIGLFISQHIVEMHNGKIWIEPNFPEGTSFKFSMPKRNRMVFGISKTANRHIIN